MRDFSVGVFDISGSSVEVARRQWSPWTHVAGGGASREEGQHGTSEHCRNPQHQRSGGHPFRDSQTRHV